MRNKLSVILLLIPLLSFSQDWQHVSTINLAKPITSYSIDNEGKLYLGTSLGELFRFDQNGKEEMHFSDIANSPVTTTEAWNRLKILTFFRDIQHVALLDRFTTTPVYYELRNFQQDMAWLCTQGVDNSLWVLSTTYNELRKYNIQTKELLFNTPLTLDLNNAQHIRAYQNLTMISDSKKGLHLFDQYANYLRTIPIEGMAYFHIYQKKVVGLINDEITSIDPFNMTVDKVKAPKGKFSAVLQGSKRYYFISGNQVHIYQDKTDK